MPEEGKNISKYSPGHKSLKAPFIIYVDFERLLKKEQPHQNNGENSYTEKKAKHKPSGYSLSLICSFDETKNRRKFYRRKDLTSLKDEETTIYESQKVCQICKEKFCYDGNKKLYQKFRDHCYYTGKFRGTAHSICNLRYKIPKNILIKVFYNDSTYDYHFIIKQLGEDFKGQFECLGENT